MRDFYFETQTNPLRKERTCPQKNIVKLLEFVPDNSFFFYPGSQYKQIFGWPMGSPVSTIVANLVMEHVEEEALASAPHPSK